MYRLKYFPSLLILVLLLLCSCSKKEFKVKVALPANVSQTYTFLYYASDPEKGWLVENVAPVEKGKAEMTGIVSNPSLVYLFGNGKIPQALFYVEKGSKISITGEGPNPTDWKITGNKITDALTDWRIANKVAISSTDPAKINKAVAEYVKQNPEDPVSAILMTVYFHRRDNEALFAKTWKLLKGEAAEPVWQNLAARSDMLAEVPHDVEFPSIVVLKTAATGCDTIRRGKVPVIFYFTRQSLDSYDRDMRTLKALSREFPDSSKRQIVDISFDPDSASRSYRTRIDTIVKGVRAWMPLGLSDQTAASLGVTRVPYEIVLDRQGRVAYRGDNLDQAISTFRSSMK